MAQFPFGGIRTTPSLGILGAWRLNDYVEVRKWQTKYNMDRRISITAWEADNTKPKITTGAITEDGKWGPQTMTAFKAWVDYKVRLGDCAATSGTEAERNGPNAAAGCLQSMTAGFSTTEIAVLQTAWVEYKAEKARQERLEASLRTACEGRGGTWNSGTNECLEPDGGGPGGDGDELSTGAKVGIVVGIIALLVGGYYLLD